MIKNIILLSSFIIFATACSGGAKKSDADSSQPIVEAGAQKADSKAAASDKKSNAKSAAKPTSKVSNISGSPSLTCKMGSETRTITKAITPNPAAGEDICQVVYTKDGQDNTIANAKHELAYCDKIVNQVRGNLENAGWTCQE